MIEITVETIADLLIALFVLSTMLSMGLELTLDEILESLSQRRLLAKSLAVNLVVVPLLALIFVLAIPMRTSHMIGLLLVAIAPGAPFGPKLAEISRSDIAFASGLMAVLGVISVATIPVSSIVLLPDTTSVRPYGIAYVIVTYQLVPLIAGLGVRAWYSHMAMRLYPAVQRLSTCTVLLLSGVLVMTNIDAFLGLIGTGSLFASIAIVGSSLLSGYALGGPTRSTREVLATTTAARNTAIALPIATTNFSDSNVITIILAFGLISIVLSGLLASLCR